MAHGRRSGSICTCSAHCAFGSPSRVLYRSRAFLKFARVIKQAAALERAKEASGGAFARRRFFVLAVWLAVHASTSAAAFRARLRTQSAGTVGTGEA